MGRLWRFQHMLVNWEPGQRPTTAEAWDEWCFDLLLAMHTAGTLSTAEVVGGLAEYVRDEAAEEQLGRLPPQVLGALAEFLLSRGREAEAERYVAELAELRPASVVA